MKLTNIFAALFLLLLFSASAQANKQRLGLSLYSGDDHRGLDQQPARKFQLSRLQYQRNRGRHQFKISGDYLQLERNAQTEQGLGDIRLSYTHWRTHQHGWWAPGLKLKAPAADDRKGLGTGKWDAELSAQLYRPGQNWNAMAQLAYIFRGSSQRHPMRDGYKLSLGTRYKFNQHWNLTGQIVEQAKSSRLSSDRRLVQGQLQWQHLRHKLALSALQQISGDRERGLGLSWSIAY